jgi:hypothetical protein
MSTILKIRKVHEEVSLRSYRALQRECANSLKPGEGELFINRAKTMARMIDSEGIVWFLDAPAKEEIDLAAVHKMAADGIGVTVVKKGASTMQKLHKVG